jgi:hypothetical protein
MPQVQDHNGIEARKQRLQERLYDFRGKMVWEKPLPHKGADYVRVRPSPFGMVPYRVEESEPILDVSDGYRLDPEQAFVTCNAYDAAILNSRNLLIADVDFPDETFPQNGPSYPDLADRLEMILRGITVLDRYLCLPKDEGFAFADQTYHIYRTHGGCRVICTSRPFPWEEDGFLATQLMEAIGTDPRYIALCRQQKCYRARLTPKPWRDHHDGCAFVAAFKRMVLGKFDDRRPNEHPDLVEQIRMHSEITSKRQLPEFFESYLA